MTRIVPPRFRLAAALVVMWLTFGSAFIGAKVGTSALPPFLFAGSRFVVAGSLLLLFCVWRAGWRLQLTWREVGEAALIGLSLILLGQGIATWSTTMLNPGIVAVLLSTMPLFAALLGRVFQGTPISGIAIAGLIAGFGGVVLLAAPSSGSGIQLFPVLMLTGGSLAWAAGTVFAGSTTVARRPLVLASLQMLIGGGAQLLTSAVLGEPGRVHLAALTPGVVATWVYLVVAVALLGFTLFFWIVTESTPLVSSSQAYVVPVVALLLGWLLLGEPIGPRTVIASGISLIGVILLVTGQARLRSRQAPALAAEGEMEPAEAA